LGAGVQSGRKEGREDRIHHFRREIIEQARPAENNDIPGQAEHVQICSLNLDASLNIGAISRTFEALIF
jgi:hypothetical protein